MRADSGFYAHTVVAACREMESPSAKPAGPARLPEEDWTPIPYWMDGAADVAETTYTPFQTKPDAAPVRLIVRRVKPTPGSQLALFVRYSYHAFITDRDGETLELFGAIQVVILFGASAFWPDQIDATPGPGRS